MSALHQVTLQIKEYYCVPQKTSDFPSWTGLWRMGK